MNMTNEHQALPAPVRATDSHAGPASQGTQCKDSCVVLQLDVRNHPGVMSHIVGLFARRACNLEGIVCLPIGDGSTSRMWLLLDTDRKLRQMTKFVANLEDVITVRRAEASVEAFRDLTGLFPGAGD